jgi:hypothetical protein
MAHYPAAIQDEIPCEGFAVGRPEPMRRAPISQKKKLGTLAVVLR